MRLPARIRTKWPLGRRTPLYLSDRRIPGHCNGSLNVIFSKLHELQTTLNEKAQNNRRLEAQRNDLNGKVTTITRVSADTLAIIPIGWFRISTWILGEDVTRRTSIITGTRILCRRSYQANGQKESFRKLFKSDSKLELFGPPGFSLKKDQKEPWKKSKFIQKANLLSILIQK